VGISEEYFPQIFKPSSQEHNIKTKNVDGAGLDLSFVKRYAELNNAQIKIKIKKGKGSSLTLFLDKKH
jgi:signal transduction histidine kinase